MEVSFVDQAIARFIEEGVRVFFVCMFLERECVCFLECTREGARKEEEKD
jgi:hypothetical protein